MAVKYTCFIDEVLPLLPRIKKSICIKKFRLYILEEIMYI